MLSSASQPAGVIASQPAAITSAKAVLPDPRAPMMATRPGLRAYFGGGMAQLRVVYPDVRYDLRRHGRARRLLAYKRAALRVDAGLTESIEHQVALDPREAIIGRLAYGLLVMGVAPMETGLAPVVSCAQLLDCRAPLTDPELALRWTA